MELALQCKMSARKVPALLKQRQYLACVLKHPLMLVTDQHLDQMTLMVHTPVRFLDVAFRHSQNRLSTGTPERILRYLDRLAMHLLGDAPGVPRDLFALGASLARRVSLHMQFLRMRKAEAGVRLQLIYCIHRHTFGSGESIRIDLGQCKPPGYAM